MDTNDIILWPDDFWCYRYELESYIHFKSDDFKILYFNTPEYLIFIETNCN